MTASAGPPAGEKNGLRLAAAIDESLLAKARKLLRQ